ncbi:hypothetical protein, partial [Tessaracoccus sp. OH4464_COT-324]|uniref:hypothetical protein n=1 Tax=Tessaracoccus sp. OH4464_COT-324 TaxID=2491059 RepID=UPI000FBD4A5D
MHVDYFDDEYDPLAPVFYSDEGEAGDDGLGDVPAADGFGAGRDVLAERETAAREAAELAAARGGFLAFSRAAGEAVAVAQERVEQAQASLGCLVGDDGGFGAGGLVRVWFDRGRRLERVRISPVWHRRLRSGWE